MIRATISRDGKVSSRDFEDVGALGAFLDAEAKAGGEVLLRIPDDKTYFALDNRLGKHMSDAQRGAQLLAGSVGHFFSPRDPMTSALRVYPTGDGWIMWLIGLQIQANAQVPRGRAG